MQNSDLLVFIVIFNFLKTNNFFFCHRDYRGEQENGQQNYV